MGDDFFKNFFLIIFGVIIFAGVIMFLQMENRTEDSKQVSNYLKTKGKTPVPYSWRDKMGSGI